MITHFYQTYCKDIIHRIYPVGFLFLLPMFPFILWAERYPILRESEATEMYLRWAFLGLFSLITPSLARRLYAPKPVPAAKIKKRHWLSLLMGWLFFIFPVFLGLLHIPMVINGLIDTAPPQTHATTISGKHTVNSITTSYFFVIPDWKRPAHTIEVAIPQALYNRKDIGDTLHLTTRKGALGTEWVADYR